MIWRLTDEVWFGDKPSAVEAVADGAKAVVCLESRVYRRVLLGRCGCIPGGGR